MNKKGWIALIATVAVIAVAAVVGPALAHGPADATDESTDGGRWYREGCFEGMGGGMRWGMWGGQHMGFGDPFGLAEAAAVLGLTPDELSAQLADGATLQDIIEAAGVDIELVVEAILAPHVETLQERVAEGHLTAEDADAMLEQMELHVEGFVSGDADGRFEMPCEIGGAGFDDHMGFGGGGRFGEKSGRTFSGGHRGMGGGMMRMW
jgi:hypothetical protein